jgi:hypothetical protein
MTQCGSGGGFHTCIAFIYLIDQSLLISFIHLFKSIKREGFVQTVPRCGGGRAAVVAEEEAAIYSGGGTGGDRR